MKIVELLIFGAWLIFEGLLVAAIAFDVIFPRREKGGPS